jgi:hypothetical protein
LFNCKKCGQKHWNFVPCSDIAAFDQKVVENIRERKDKEEREAVQVNWRSDTPRFSRNGGVVKSWGRNSVGTLDAHRGKGR